MVLFLLVGLLSVIFVCFVKDKLLLNLRNIIRRSLEYIYIIFMILGAVSSHFKVPHPERLLRLLNLIDFNFYLFYLIKLSI